MKVVVIKSIEDDKEILRGLKGEIQNYVVIDKVVNAVIITTRGDFQVVPLSHLGKGHDLGYY